MSGTSRRTRLPNAGRGERRVSDAAVAGGRPTPVPTTERGRRTRAQLLAAARRVFERDGFLHARIGDICDEAGISHGSFYTYFASKEEIFQEVIVDVELDLLSFEPPPQGADPAERIAAANRHYLEAMQANAGIINVIRQVVTFDPQMRASSAQRDAAFLAALERSARRYQADGIADPRIDPKVAAVALGGMVDAFATYLFLRADAPPVGDLGPVVEQLTLLWVNALGIKGGAAAR